MRRHLFRLALMPALALSLQACALGPTVLMAGASMTSLAHTDKTLGDHVATWAFDKDCSILYATDGEPYCQRFETEEERLAAEAEAAAQRAQTYCYRTLGAISCYREPDSMASSQARVQ